MRTIDADALIALVQDSTILGDGFKQAFCALVNGEPTIEPEIMPDGTLHITANADVANIDRILLSQAGTHFGDLYYKDAKADIVRCKDCRWQKDQSGSTAWLPCRALVTPDDFYCGYAERKDDV